MIKGGKQMSGEEAIEGAIERIITLSETTENEWNDSGDWDNWSDHGF